MGIIQVLWRKQFCKCASYFEGAYRQSDPSVYQAVCPFHLLWFGSNQVSSFVIRSSIVSFGNDGTFSENTITMVKEELTASNISYVSLI